MKWAPKRDIRSAFVVAPTFDRKNNGGGARIVDRPDRSFDLAVDVKRATYDPRTDGCGRAVSVAGRVDRLH